LINKLQLIRYLTIIKELNIKIIKIKIYKLNCKKVRKLGNLILALQLSLFSKIIKMGNLPLILDNKLRWDKHFTRI